MTLINRSYLDHGSLRRTRHISHTNAIFRRSVLASHRLPAQGGPFGAALHAAAILDEGCQVLSDPDIKAVHSFQGWAMMRDIQRHLGYSSIRSRQLDERVPYAWTGRLGYFSLPIVAFGRTTSNLTRCLRLHRLYDVRWYELPAVLALSVFVHLLELPGMFRAVRRQPIEQTAYR